MSLITNPSSFLDSNNTSTILLSANETYSGISTLTNGYGSLVVTIKSNTNSANCGIKILFSCDNFKWYTKYTNNYDNMKNFTEKYLIENKYYKVLYVNGSTDQTSFFISSILSPCFNGKNTEITFPNEYMDFDKNLKVIDQQTLLELRFYSNPLFPNSTNSICENRTIMTQFATDKSFTSDILNTVMTINATKSKNGGRYVNQTKRYASSQSYKTLRINKSGILNNGPNVDIINSSGCTSKIGYFDDNDGVYFAYNLITGVTVNSKTSRGNTITSVAQNDWNYDVLNGTGPSGINVDWTKEQSFIMQFLSSGSGPLLFALKLNEHVIVCHIIFDMNILIGPWINNSNLPLRSELICSDSSDIGSMISGYGNVISMGNHSSIGRTFSVSNGNKQITMSNSGETALLAITGCVDGEPSILRSTVSGSRTNTYYHQNIILNNASLLCTSGNDVVLFRIRYYLSGTAFSSSRTTWTDVNSEHSVVKYTTEIPNLIVDDSIVIYESYVYSRAETLNLSDFSNVFNTITSDISNVPDVIIITGEKIIGSTVNCLASLRWQENY